MEVWKEIFLHNKKIFVSNLGNIKNKKKYSDSRGYQKVSFYEKDRNYPVSVHRLVAMAFIPNPKNKPQINHINGIKSDNRVQNLEWVTQSENNMHATRILGKKNPMLGKKGALHHNSRKIDQFEKSGKFVKRWDSMHDICRNYKIGLGNLWACCNFRQKSGAGYVWRYSNAGI